MISFQNFSFRYEESKDFTLRGIDMTVRTGEFYSSDRAKWLRQDNIDSFPQWTYSTFLPR